MDLPTFHTFLQEVLDLPAFLEDVLELLAFLEDVLKLPAFLDDRRPLEECFWVRTDRIKLWFRRRGRGLSWPSRSSGHFTPVIRLKSD